MADGTVDAVLEVFRAELDVPDCGPCDSLFQLGGDSLLANRVLARLNDRYAVRIPFAEVYRDSSPVAIARTIEELLQAPRKPRRSVMSTARRRRQAWFPLALAQRTLYAMDRATQGAGLFNNVGVWRLTGDVDPDALRSALDDVRRRQSALRLVFGAEQDRPVQRFSDDLPAVETRDLRGTGESVRRFVRRERLLGFDLHAAPPARFTLARTADDEWTLVSTFHHIIFDGMSQSLFVRDLAGAYAHRVGAGDESRPPALDYRDFVDWQQDTLRGERLDDHLESVRATLCRAPVRRFAPGDGPDGQFLTRARPFTVDQEVVRGLRALAAGADTTMFVALVAAVSEFAARWSGSARSLVAIQTASRTMDGTEELVGCFANTVCVGLDHVDRESPAQYLPAAQDAVSAALSHQELPLEVALDMLARRDVDVPGPENLPQLGFALQPARRERIDLPGCRLTAEYVVELGDAVDPAAFPLVLEMFDENGGLDGVSHHRIADWSDSRIAAALGELHATFGRFSLTDNRKEP